MYRTNSITKRTHCVEYQGGPTIRIVETESSMHNVPVQWQVLFDMRVAAEGPATDLKDAKIKAEIARRLVECLRRLHGERFDDGGYAVDRELAPFRAKAVAWLRQCGEIPPEDGDGAEPSRGYVNQDGPAPLPDLVLDAKAFLGS